MERLKILCVDDEPQVLEGLGLHLRREYKVLTATGGKEGLGMIAEQGPFAVVLSDMRMPEMNGAVFLSKVREAAPDTTRMLLTGYSEMDSAISAVNDGQIFRFLTKPCPPDKLRLAFEAAVEQHRLVTAERVLLEQTLHGSIKTLTDVLSMTNPLAFGRATRLKKLVSDLAEAIALPDRWQVEVAAMLSQLGYISLPEETAEKYFYGREMTNPEKEMVSRIPEVTGKLLANIPRLESVQEILRGQTARFDAGEGKGEIPKGARLLKVAVEYDELESKGYDAQLAIDTMFGREGWYDPDILQELIKLKNASAEQRTVKEIPLVALQEGMVFAEEVRMKNGLLLVARGYEVTQSFMEKVRNFKSGSVDEPLRVIVKNQLMEIS